MNENTICPRCNGTADECNRDCTCGHCGHHDCSGGCSPNSVLGYRRLFATAVEVGCPPVAHGDADLSRIRVTAPATLEEYDRLHAELEVKRAERKAKRDRIEGVVGLAGLGAL